MNPINEKVHFDDYQFFTIYPINYVVAKNEDIFEYVKRDILLQLYNQNLLDKLNLKDLFDSVFSYEDLKSVISFLLCLVPGGAFSDKLFHIVDKKYHDYQEKKETFKKFELKFENQIGGIYENDGYIQMIKYALDIIKNGDSEATKRKPVLVIEDLDRLDPAHLFRILNIISAHIDQTSYNNDNKFGFNNIILVMDYEATKHVFHYFYGERANYEGYISKFLSVPPFYYSVKELVIKQVKNSIFNIIGCMDALHSFSLFNEKIASMSMRDLFKLQGFKCNKRIKAHAVSIWNLTFSTEMPLYRLIIYMCAAGMSMDEILRDFANIGTSLSPDHIKLLLPLYCYEDKKMNIYYQIDQNKWIKPEYGLDENNVINIVNCKLCASFELGRTRKTKNISKNALTEFIERIKPCLNLSCIE